MLRNSSEHITPREAQVMGLYAKGKTYKQIAKELGIDDDTVRSHLANVRTRLSVSNTRHAITVAVSKGIIAI